MPKQVYVLDDLHDLAGKPDMSSISKDFTSFLNENSFLVSVLNNAASFFFIIDFANMRYLYVSEGIVNLMGYTAEEWKNEGINAAFRTIHQDDRSRLKKVHEDQFKFLFEQPVEERLLYKFSTNFRVIRKDGTEIWLMTHDSFIALDTSGKPSVAFEVCTDITTVKKDLTMTFSIFRNDTNGLIKTINKFYYPINGSLSFTSREIEVLQLVRQGLNTRSIAEKLYISELTVSKHKKNMMDKAKVNNANALVHYAVVNGLIF